MAALIARGTGAGRRISLRVKGTRVATRDNTARRQQNEQTKDLQQATDCSLVGYFFHYHLNRHQPHPIESLCLKCITSSPLSKYKSWLVRDVSRKSPQTAPSSPVMTKRLPETR